MRRNLMKGDWPPRFTTSGKFAGNNGGDDAPNHVRGITNYIRANYPATILNLPVFNPANFPAGVPYE